MQQGTLSGAAWIASADAAVRETFLSELEQIPGALLALPYLFEFWAHAHQLPPEGDWRNWVVLGGRGAGKTRAGAEWVRSQVEGARPMDEGRCKRIALVGETIEQVREVMIFGDSGIMACSPPDRQPEWLAMRKMLRWPNGALAVVCSAHDPESLRGPQFDGAWVDELAKWRRAQEAWDMLQFTLRLGDDPKVCVTTTPRNVGVLKTLLASSSTVVTRAPTEANEAYLASSFLEEVRARFAGSRLARQELDGDLLDEVDGALWPLDVLEAARCEALPEFDRVVVAVDPPAGSSKRSDACGIVVAGVVTDGPPQDWRAVVLEDASVQGVSPLIWARRAITAMERWGAQALVAEVNQGGDMVETVLRQVDPMVPVVRVHASKSKGARAEPVAALYEQGRVSHHGVFDRLEDEMSQMTRAGFQGTGSPDRVDALVWALTDLVISRAAEWRRPRVRTLVR
ncbi:DNA-packaging protein [Marivita hallyeonensis]|uniref:Large terminase phage packaging protein n=1 Tax=Marivita hallyeonensis TaxID=996342 RepID=A0A1M5RP65_9RHOB|nr:terminase family protein [Marivita hallyeonensis]SHH28095.1 Large terminase phage packaging protein [Marivita hallyeonensis]